MTTKKILVTGFGAEATEDNISSWLAQFGPVEKLEIIREGNEDHPVVLVEMAIDDAGTAHLLSRLTDYWHDGKLVNARLLHH